MKATKHYLLKLLFVVCVLFSFMAVSASAATTYKSENGLFEFVLSNGNAVITNYTGLSSTLTIEPTIKNATGTKTYNVISIGNGSKPIISTAESKAEVKKIIIPSSAIRIATNAFLDCSNLTEVTIGAGVKTIGDSAFQGCTSLKTVNVPTSAVLTSIGDACFYGCKSLTDFNCGPKMESIGESAFANCKALTQVVFSPTLQVIGENAFKACSALTSASDAVSHSSDPVRYGSVTFDNYLPATLEVLGAYAFYGTALQDYIVVPAKVLDISESAFQNCKKLKGVYLTTGVTSIGPNAFRACTGLEYLFAPKSIDDIDETAFAGAALDDTRTEVYLFKKSYIDNYLNDTKQYNAGMFHYLNAATVPANTAIKLEGVDCPDPAKPVIWAGQTVELALTYVDATSGLPIAPPTSEIGDNIRWTTNNASAVIFARKNQDSAIVTSIKAGVGYVVKAALNDDVTGDITIKVNAAPKTVVIKQHGSKTAATSYTVNLMKAKSIDLDATTAPVDGAEIEWTSSNTKIATVDNTGLVKWNGTEGTATITATAYNGKKCSTKVTFKYSYDTTNYKAFVKDETIVLTMGTGPYQLTTKPTGFASTTKYSFSDKTVVNYDKLTGKITPLKTGATVLTGTDVSGTIPPLNKAYKFTCTIIVKPAKQLMDATYKKTASGYRVSWHKVLNGSGYDIQVKAPGSSSFKTVVKDRKKGYNYYVFKDFKKKKTYQVRVRSFFVYKGKRYNGAWSDPLDVKTK